MDNVLITAGIVFVAAAIVGGGLKAFQMEVPALASVRRQLLLGALGALLVGVGVAPGLNRTRVPAAPEGSDPPLEQGISIPNLVNLSQKAAEDTLRRLQLVVGHVEESRAWVPAGNIIRQEPAAAQTVAPGSEVNLVISGAPYVFRSHRALVTPQGDTIVGEAVYNVRPIRSVQGDTAIEFTLESAAVTPADDVDPSNVLSRLVGRQGQIPLSAIRTFDVSRDWQPFADVAGELEHAVSAATISEEHDLSALGPALSTALIGHQLNFDLRTLLTAVPPSVADGNAVELQAGTALLSSIRLGGTARSTTIGSESHRAFNIVRRAPGQDARNVGTAFYRSDNGLLAALDMRYVVSERGGAYRLLLRQQ